MKKKALANMWWIIVGAVAVLVVMIVLMVIFTEKTGKLDTGLSSCEGKGGVCVVKDTDCPASTLISPIFDCDEGYDCCVGSPQKCREECPEAKECVEGEWCP